MKAFTLFFPLVVLISFQLLGEACVQFTHQPIPGAVVGAVLLFGALFLIPGLHARIATASHLLVKNMLFFYVPISVGLMEEGALLRQNLWLMIAVVSVATWITALTAAWAFQWLERKEG